MKLENSEADGEGDCQHLASSDISQVRRSFKLQWVILYCPTAGHHQEKYPYIFGPSDWVLLPNSAKPRDRRDTVYQHVSQVCKRCPVQTEFHLHSSLQKEIWNFILLVSYNSRAAIPPVTIRTTADARQPMVSIQTHPPHSKHWTLRILNWFLSCSTVGLLQHTTNSTIHWQELVECQNYTENLQARPLWYSKALKLKMQ